MLSRACGEREASVTEALAIIESVLADAALTVAFVSGGPAGFPVHRCSVHDRDGRLVAESLGKGRGAQSRASALFEAWQHLQHQRGQARLPTLTDRVACLSIADVLAQPPLGQEQMLRRLGSDFPDVAVACLRLEPLRGGGEPLWYPAFTRSPSCRDHPIPGDDLDVYAAYLRYAFDNGTATGVSRAEALLHGLLEVIERDALSHALLDWYLGKSSPIRVIDPVGLSPELRNLHRDIGPVLLAEITSDLAVPAYCAIPAVAGEHPGVLGSGASLRAGYAMERALTELAQSTFNMSLGVDTTLDNRLATLRPWPLLERCAHVDPESLLPRLVFAEPAPSDPPGPSVHEQIDLLLDRLEAAGLAAYSFEWTEAGTRCPVLTVIVPGLDAFSMVHNAVPVLPTGRAMRLLAGRM
jgi:ribosomal protein S12 methylthiotransferase accessory factor